MKSKQQDTDSLDHSQPRGLSKLFSRKTNNGNAKPSHSGSVESTPNTIESGLENSRGGLLQKLGAVFQGTFDLNDELFEELEEVLMSSDIGVKASLELVDKLRERVTREKIRSAEEVLVGLRAEISEVLQHSEEPWEFNRPLHVLLMVGVNGVGKTTTTAKIAQRLKLQGKSVMLAAADTFRAAAVEQLQEWGRKLEIPVIYQGSGADAAAVAHDALISAKAKHIDVLIIDTAGRLHTQTDLMEQLQKVTRVLRKLDPDAPHEVMQILDASTGQNALTQLHQFQQSVGVNSLAITKLDGSAKGGVAIGLAQQFSLPIRFIGVGEAFNDLRPFAAEEFSKGLIPDINNIPKL